MIVGELESKKGAVVKGYLPGGEYACGAQIRIPLAIAEGTQEGPTLWLGSTIHGDELNGIYVLRQLIDEIDPSKLKGTVIFTPLLNPTAFQARQKFTGVDQLDGDQQFPGNPNGWFSERFAYTLFQQMKAHANYLICLHTLGPVYDAVPYTVYKKLAGCDPAVNAMAKKMALTFGLKAACEVDLSNTGNELPGAIEKNMDVNCLRNGIPAIMAECGSGGCLQPENIDLAKNGIYNVMSLLGMIDRPITYLREDRIIVTKRKFPTCSRGGLFVPFVKAGQVLEKGTKIGKVFSPLEDLEVIETDCTWYPLGIRNNPAVDSGEIIGAMALEWIPAEDK